MSSLNPSGETRSLRQEVNSAEDRLRRSSASGKNAAETITVKVSGRGQLVKVEVQADAYGLSDRRKKDLESAIAEAVNAALAKQRRRVERELSKLMSQD